MAVPVGRVAVVQARQVLADAKARRKRQGQAALLGRRGGVAPLGMAGRQRGAVHRIGRADAAQCLDRVVVAAGGEAGARQVVPEPLRVIGIEAHRLPDPVDAFDRLAEPGEQLALLDHDQVVVRVQAEGAPLVVGRQLVVLLDQVDRRQDAVHVAVVVVEGEGDSPAPP